MGDEDRKTRLEYVRRYINSYRQASLAWSTKAAESAVQELLVGKMIRSDQADAARPIIAQELHEAFTRSVSHVLAQLQQPTAEGRRS